MSDDIIDLVVDEDGNYVPDNHKEKKEHVEVPKRTKKIRRKLVRKKKKKHIVEEAGGELLTGIKAGLGVVDELLSTLNKFNRGL